MSPSAIPEGYSSVTPYLILRNAAAALDYYTKAFGAKELFRLPAPDGKIGHAEMQIGDSKIMMADEQAEHRGPESLGGTSVSLLLYVDDVDAVFQRALSAGGSVILALANQFYGDRSGTLRDPFGHLWTIATHVEDVSPAEMDRRMKEMSKEGGHP